MFTIHRARPYFQLFPAPKPEEDYPQAVDPEELEDYARKLFQFSGYQSDVSEDHVDIINSPYNELDVDLSGNWNEDKLSATFFSGGDLEGGEYDYPSGVDDHREPYTPCSRGSDEFNRGAFSGSSLEIWDKEPEGGWQGAFSPRVRPTNARYFDADELYEWIPNSNCSVEVRSDAGGDDVQSFRRRPSLCAEEDARVSETGERVRRGSREGTDLAELFSPRFVFSGTLSPPVESRYGGGHSVFPTFWT
ncbi:unnamed protein product [Cyclocybe aegerita]|uniref:Uncharacterized protein n=1 Tax=Cyclocybe aegerita TaxID=1973307 RepID=A0A8S0XW78_CYCAE|nr:unnamed protein product [Cyclocybe aegerita]